MKNVIRAEDKHQMYSRRWRCIVKVETHHTEENIMPQRILVTYASRTGTTAEIAKAIGKTLEDSHTQIDVMPMQSVSDVTPYHAVIAGSAIRDAKWLPEAVQFIRTHQSTLRHKPFAIYTVCITLAMSNGERYRSGVTEWTAPVRAIVQPLSEGLFAGMLDFHKLPFNLATLRLRATVALGIFPREDRRDWNAIRTWALKLKPMLSIPVRS
jgi:menaquinone-dependent protoporphyrinogen oxidase